MNVKWFPVKAIKAIDRDVEIVPSSPGIYVIFGNPPIYRIRGKDKAGILYIGKARNLQRRLYQFWDGYHTASGFLYQHWTLAEKLLNRVIKNNEDIYDCLAKLKFRVACPISKSKIEKAERAALFAYIKHYGEAPPLNLSLPKRWKTAPPWHEVRWGERGILL
jgi:hypothetical protein